MDPSHIKAVFYIFLIFAVRLAPVFSPHVCACQNKDFSSWPSVRAWKIKTKSSIVFILRNIHNSLNWLCWATMPTLAHHLHRRFSFLRWKLLIFLSPKLSLESEGLACSFTSFLACRGAIWLVDGPSGIAPEPTTNECYITVCNVQCATIQDALTHDTLVMSTALRFAMWDWYNLRKWSLLLWQ